MTIDKSKITMPAHEALLSRSPYLSRLFPNFAGNFLCLSTDNDFTISEFLER